MDQLVAFLQEIKNARIQKNISVEDISQNTKINLKFIEYLENGRIDFLPQPYVRAFIKSYARAVGISQREIEDKFAQISAPPPPQVEKSPKTEESPKIPEKKEAPAEQPLKIKIRHARESGDFLKGSTVRILLLVIPLIAGLIYVGNQLNRTRSRFEVANIPVTEEEKKNVMLEKVPEPEVVQTNRSLLELRAAASGTTWMRIIIDRRDTTEHNLRQGDQVNWNAFSQFQLRVGRAHAIRLFLNGNDLGALGPDTQLIWEMLVTAKGIEAKELRTRTDLSRENPPPAAPAGQN